MSETVNNPQEFDVAVPDIPMPQAQETQEIKDEIEGGFKFAFIGSGQGGGRIAHTFYKLGYRRVCAVNTAEQDLATLPLPNKMLLGKSGGAGKNPSVAKAAFKDNKEDVLDFMRRSFGQTLDRIFVCAGAGASISNSTLQNIGGGLKFRTGKRFGLIAEYRHYSIKKRTQDWGPGNEVSFIKRQSNYFGLGIAYLYWPAPIGLPAAAATPGLES